MRPEAGADATGAPEDGEELLDLDQRARERAVQILTIGGGPDPRSDNGPLRIRLRELEIITHRPFVPGARIGDR